MAVDPNIKKKADDIRNKVYGREVRESLASGLEEISSDVVENEGRQSVVEGRQDSVESQWQVVSDEMTDKDVISAPEIISARNGKPNLKTRIDDLENETTTQLAQNEINAKTPPKPLAGLKGDGSDETNVLQSLIEYVENLEGSVLKIPKGVYHTTMVNISKPIKIIGETGAVLKVPNGTDYSPNRTLSNVYATVFYVTNVQGLTLENLIIDGNRDELNYDVDTASSDGHAIGIQLRGSSDIIIKNVKLKNCGTDGMKSSNNTNMLITHSTFDNNRRQGWSVTGGDKNVLVDFCIFSNTRGISPESGVDIETNNRETVPENITFRNCLFENNFRGLIVTNTAKNIRVIDCDFLGYQYIYGGISLHDSVQDISVKGCLFEGSGYNSMPIHISETVEKVVIEDNFFRNNQTVASTNGDITTNGKNILIKDNVFENSNMAISATSSGKVVVFEGNIIKNPHYQFAALLATPNSIVTNNKIIGEIETNVSSFRFGSDQSKGIYVGNSIDKPVSMQSNHVRFGVQQNNAPDEPLTGVNRRVPTYGSWKVGDYVKNSEVSIRGTTPDRKITLGWVRITDGEDNVLGVDWVAHVINVE